MFQIEHSRTPVVIIIVDLEAVVVAENAVANRQSGVAQRHDGSPAVSVRNGEPVQPAELPALLIVQ